MMKKVIVQNLSAWQKMQQLLAKGNNTEVMDEGLGIR